MGCHIDAGGNYGFYPNPGRASKLRKRAGVKEPRNTDLYDGQRGRSHTTHYPPIFQSTASPMPANATANVAMAIASETHP